MMRAFNVWRRIKRSGARMTPVILGDALRRAMAPLLDRRLAVLRYEGQPVVPGGAAGSAVGLEIACINQVEDFPVTFLPQSDPELLAMGKVLSAELARGAQAWIGLVDGAVAASACTIEANRLDRWHVAIEPHDIVIYATVTLGPFRGRGLHTALLSEIVSHLGGTGGQLYADVAAWNKVSLRNFERLGFRTIVVNPDPKPRVALP
jgi:GNAT superfamily N-acetyltransferase